MSIRELNAIVADRERLCLFTETMTGGGVQRVTALLANALSRRGHCVDVVLIKAEGPNLALLDPEVSVIDLHTSGMANSILALRRYLRRRRPRAMLAAGTYLNLMAAVAKRLAWIKTRLVLAEHTSPSGLGLGRRAKLTFYYRHLYKWADAVIAVSEGIRQDLVTMARLPANFVTTVYNPIVDADIVGKAKGLPGHPWLKNTSCPIFIAVGQLKPVKNFPSLLRAFAKVLSEQPAKLLIVGEGSERAALERLIEDLGIGGNVELPGYQENIPAWIAHASALVLSSRNEGLPTVLIEALACGTPIVSTDCHTGPAEILDNGHYGLLVPPGDVDALAHAMKEVLANGGPASAEQLRARAELFSVERSVRAYEHLLVPTQHV